MKSSKTLGTLKLQIKAVNVCGLSVKSPVVTIEIKKEKTEGPILVKKDTHCDEWGKYRLEVLSGKHDVASCNLECNKNDRCV